MPQRSRRCWLKSVLILNMEVIRMLRTFFRCPNPGKHMISNQGVFTYNPRAVSYRSWIWTLVLMTALEIQTMQTPHFQIDLMKAYRIALLAVNRRQEQNLITQQQLLHNMYFQNKGHRGGVHFAAPEQSLKEASCSAAHVK